jgi:hypothetical protein
VQGRRAEWDGSRDKCGGGYGEARGQRDRGVSRTTVVEDGRRWCSSMAAHGERGDEATARAFKRWVRLTGGPSLFLIFLKIFKHPNIEIQNDDLPHVSNSPNFG